ncbi:hypothetical protein [Pyxidicoccus sp. MSG2]|uniref:hypothetical protein n=1 Tax=Pyxidicoccus sp. MSG2 TaxID=2996790 RepID=UPI00226EC49C|nr:hypothetical protein [Pyxidicoccus sp. MSG2]MCY1020046.1 hypothetical protein [Pyxidicoccus sp. MSG2]
MLVRKVAINEEQVRAFLSNLFEEDLHAQRVLSLSHANVGRGADRGPTASDTSSMEDGPTARRSL